MKRRESLKALTLGSLSGLSLLNPETANATENIADTSLAADTPIVVPGGRTKAEAIRDAELMKQKFFTEHEWQTVRVLVDIIIPADKVSGSATQAKVPEFIEFMMKDQPANQTAMRGGLIWMDVQTRKRFQKPFVGCTKIQQVELIDDIAYPEKAKPELSQGVAFFNLLRNYTATGFFTSQMGLKDLGYVGNTPNQWQGVPDDVLKQYGLSYE
jgi:gluconate 2-dehydrogenase gamma chain